MKVLLTQPITAFVKEPPNSPDIGLGYLATALKKSGHAVFVRDWNMNPSVSDFIMWLSENSPDVIGLKVFTKDVYAAKKTIAQIRETLPNSIVIIGGPHPSAVDPEELMDDFAYCDFAIKGEAESILPSLLYEISPEIKNSAAGYLTQEDALKMPGLVWREKDKVYSNPIAFEHNLDRIDFPCWELIDPCNYNVDMLGPANKVGTTAPLITTRGCPGRCSFCSAFNVNGRKIRTRSPENVIKEMLLLYNKYNVRKFMFQDNCFTSIRGNLKNICELIIREKMQIEWDCVSYERLDNLTEEVLSLMYEAGCRMIHMGIESGSEKTRKTMHKACSLVDITLKNQLIKKSGIKVGAWFMLGFPHETEKDMKDTISYAFSLDAELITFTICFPLPGSDVYNYIKEKYKFNKIDWSVFDIYKSVYPVSEISSRKTARLLKRVRLRIRIDNKIKKLTSILHAR